MPPEHFKLEWDHVKRMLPPKADHPDIVALLQSGGKRVTIPIKLYYRDKENLTATVNFFASNKRLNIPALNLVLAKLKDEDLSVQWDAVSFGEGKPITPRNKLFLNDHYSAMIRHYRYMDLFPTLEELLKKSETGKAGDTTMERYAAAILSHSAEIESPFIDRAIQRHTSFFDAVKKALRLS